MATTVTLTTADGDMGLYDVEPEGEARAAVIVVQEAFGVNPHIEDVTRRVAAAGYRAVAPHLFHRTGDPVIEYGDFDKVMPQFAGISEAGLLNDLDASIGYLGEAGFAPARIGIVGFCMGGTVAFQASAHRPLGAAVTFYGGGVTEGRFGSRPMVELAPQLKAPWLGLFGDEDARSPSTRSRPCDRPWPAPRSTPRSCATPVPGTASTAISAPTSTKRPPPTGGNGRSPGSGSTSRPTDPRSTGPDPPAAHPRGPRAPPPVRAGSGRVRPT